MIKFIADITYLNECRRHSFNARIKFRFNEFYFLLCFVSYQLVTRFVLKNIHIKAK